MSSSKSSSFQKMRLVRESELEDLKQQRRRSTAVKDIRQYNPTLDSLASVKLEMDSVLDRNDLLDADKLILLNALRSRFNSLKPGIAVAAPPPAAPAAPPPAATGAGPQPPPAAVFDAATHRQYHGLNQLHIPIQYANKLERFTDSVLDPYAEQIGAEPNTGELVIDGEPVAGSRFDDLIRECYLHSANHNLIGLDIFLSKLHSLDPIANLILNNASSTTSTSTSSHNPHSYHEAKKFISNPKIISRLFKDIDNTSFDDAMGSVPIPTSATSSSTSIRTTRNHHPRTKYSPPIPPGKNPLVFRVYK